MYKSIDIAEIIQSEKEKSTKFQEAWDSSRMEYKILGELIRVRKEKGLTQAELAQLSGYKQQAISRIEKKDNSPSLKTLCHLLEVMNCELQIVSRS